MPEAHAALGLIKMLYEWDWSSARREFLRAIELNPNYALARQRFGLYLNLSSRPVEALRQLEPALITDPLSPQIYWCFALTFFLASEYEEAIEEVNKTLELDPSYQPALYLLGRVHNELGQFSEAISVFENLLRLNNSPMFAAALGHVYGRAGMYRKAQAVLDELEVRAKHQYVSAYAQASVLVALGNQNQTFSSLEQAYVDHCEMMTWLKVDPAFSAIRADERFVRLVQQIGLAPDARTSFGNHAAHRLVGT